MSFACEHGIPSASYMVIPGAPRGALRFYCPCCRLEGWQGPEEPLNLDEVEPCPYCDVQAVAVEA